MKDAYTQGILDKASVLMRLEGAAQAMPADGGLRSSLRAVLAAALAALLALVPAVSAAQMIL